MPRTRARGRRIERYTLYDQIAAGGIASVHLATVTAAGGFRKVVAVKRLHPHLRNNRELCDLFLDEARVSARIVHTNVVQTLDVLKVGDDIAMVMEYVEGEALHRLFEAATAGEGTVPLRVAVAIGVGSLRGLAAAHQTQDAKGQSLGLIHRDVSPQNILVGVDGVARLIDFGIARAGLSNRWKS